jgi:hypothetical protein
MLRESFTMGVLAVESLSCVDILFMYTRRNGNIKHVKVNLISCNLSKNMDCLEK